MSYWRIYSCFFVTFKTVVFIINWSNLNQNAVQFQQWLNFFKNQCKLFDVVLRSSPLYNVFWCRELAKDFVVAGTAGESLYGACEAMFKPDMVCNIRFFSLLLDIRMLFHGILCIPESPSWLLDIVFSFYNALLTLWFNFYPGTWGVVWNCISSFVIICWPWLFEWLGRTCLHCVRLIKLHSVIPHITHFHCWKQNYLCW